MATLSNLTVNDTGYLRVPQGTTAQRPGSPTAGMLRFNTDYNVNEYYNGSAWVTMSGAIASATGGTLTGNSGAASIGGSRIATFTSGTGTFTPVYSGSVEVFIVGGGGSGGGLGGGGGAGGVIYQGAFPVTGGVGIPVSVGAGAGYTSSGHGPAGANGSNTTFGTLTARGGGGGSGYYVPVGSINPGGSGGGGPGYGYTDGQTVAGEGTTGQGHPGGYGFHGGTGPASQNSPQPGASVHGGGGGGGAGEKGIPRWSWHADAKGGDGIASSIRGTEVQYFGGGGGGGGHSGGSHSRPGGSTGGLGGGGAAGQSGPQAAHDARTNSGGGGGGAHHPDAYRSGNGGPGIVVVRYKG